LEMVRTALRRGGEMQIVEYLYGMVHGNDLHGGIELLGRDASFPTSFALESKVKPNQIGYILLPYFPHVHIAPLENFAKVETHDCTVRLLFMLFEWSLESICASMDGHESYVIL